MQTAEPMPDPATTDSHVFYRKLTRRFPSIVRGEGCYLYDEAGRRYLDGCGGAFVANLGHGVGEIADAIVTTGSDVSLCERNRLHP